VAHCWLCQAGTGVEYFSHTSKSDGLNPGTLAMREKQTYSLTLAVLSLQELVL
jgi:hypothetical protein